ncbi:zinc finger protein 292a [Misgurnus anguillicaudatus]|uniref:zinc finger protein 292a n=1 Tax=Misgurnus anguillicaudatus TaxID=75329 RepID=UPI003CCF83AB
MAEEEDSRAEAVALRHRFQDLISEFKRSSQSPLDASNSFCQDFCEVLMNQGHQRKPDEDQLSLLEMYSVAIVCFAEASPYLCPECEHVTDVLEKLSWSCLNLLLSFSEQIPGALWEEFHTSVTVAHGILQAHGNSQLHTLLNLVKENGVWTNVTLCSLLSNNMPDIEKVHEFLAQEGPELLHMRIKHLMKQKLVDKAARLAKTCAEFPEFGRKKNFKQIYLVCLCEINSQELMQEIKEVDCKDALDMICNLEAEEDEKGALSLCTAFFKRQLLSGDVYCAWELTLFWSKLLIRLESKQTFLDQCRMLARLSGSVYHILLLIKVVQAEVDKDGLSTCIEMCIQALKMGVHDSEDASITICKTISCLLPLDIEVKRACQLTEFLVNPSLDSYYSVETIFNEPDQKLEEEDPLILNSLRCDLLLALKTKWPFDPEFWDWKTLKRHCIGLMGQEAADMVSADKLSESEENEAQDAYEKVFKDLTQSLIYEPGEGEAERKKKTEMKKVKEKGFVSARFRNWQAYMQYCVLCDKEFLGHRIVKHALKHVQDGIFRCPICTKSFPTRAVLEPHVMSHVKQSCQERLAAMNITKKSPIKLKSPSTLDKQKHYVKTATQGPTICSDASKSSPSANGEDKIIASFPKPCAPKQDVNNTKDLTCPVTSCQKVFKYFRNLVAHVKAHKNEPEAVRFLEVQSRKAMCQYCHRQFVNLTHLNDHLQMHCGDKPYFCIQLGCNCTFSSHAELLVHRKVHAEFQAQCTYPNCERIFSETYLLYDHEAQHYMNFTCKRQNCAMVFCTVSDLDMHQQEHAKQDHSAVRSQIESPAQTCLALEPFPSQIKEVSQEPSVVKMKCSVKKIKCSQGPAGHPEQLVTNPALSKSVPIVSQTSTIQPHVSDASQCLQSNPESPEKSHLESCFVKLEPIPVQGDDPVFTKTQTFLEDKKLFCNPLNQLTHATPESSNVEADANKEKRPTHACPFETCTRLYSTSKSLSRHVKNFHPDAFEEWKLSKKYKRIAEIAARKSSSKPSNTGSQKIKKQTSNACDPTRLDSSILSCHDESVSSSSQLKDAQGHASPNHSALMQLPLSQTWATSAMDDMDSSFNVQNHYSPITSSDNQHIGSLYHSDAIMDYASASVYDGMIPLSANVHTPSSVMNEASKYVSSSLRVLHALNGDQTFDVDLGYGQIGQNHPNEIPVSASLLHTASLPEQNTSSNFSAFPPETNPASEELLGNSNQEICTAAQLFSSDIKCIPNLTHHFKEHSEDFPVKVVSPLPQADEKHPEEFCNHELSTKEPEEQSPSDEQPVVGKKAKKMKSSKKSKWPAIIEGGKVICCRCYREFPSTKSLGGHLSKRSQCKTVDEIDLTADLPTSFLDFLNDPDISIVPMPIPTNNMHEQDPKSLTSPLQIHPPLDSNVFTESVNDTNCSIHNSNVPPQEPSEMTASSSLCQSPVQEPRIESKPESEIPPANTGEDGKIVEIERALQRLDLVDILNQETSVTESADQQSKSSQIDIGHMIKNEVENKQKVFIVKPFKCKEEDCTYGSMTKEALFNHLSRIHEYSEEKINEMKKNPDKFAPYSCHLCTKAFTRTTGLKIHYMNVHHLSKEEVSGLKMFGERKVRKSKAESADVHCSPITKQANELPGQQQHKVSPKVTKKSISSKVKKEAVSVAAKKTPKKSPKKDSPKVLSSKISKTVEASQGNVGNFDGLATNAIVKTFQGTSNTPEKQEPCKPSVFAVQEPSVISPFSFGTMNDPAQATKGATPQLNNKIETKPDKEVELEKNNNLPVDYIDLSDTLHLCRPYRCVHEGCVASFSIQQNLILHYRAMHQSECDENTGACTKEADGSVQVQEYKCQVKQCSKVVSKVTSLLKHYLLLHRCTLEKTSELLSAVEVGTFQCDQSKCSAHFTCHLKYIDHIKNDHKVIKVSADGDFRRVDLTFRCQFEDCGRVYTTKSNLLRHLMKKHQETFETLKKKQDAMNRGATKLSTSADPNNGKENIANNVKVKKKKTLKKKEDKGQNHWMTFATPVLKSIDEASAMCNNRFLLQYPCMIKNCDSVMSAEQEILKHYTTHGLTERFIEDQRSQFIFCKKSKEISGLEECDVEEMVLDEDKTENTSVSTQNVSQEVQMATDVTVNESFTATTVVKQKRGRPRKSESRKKICLERRRSLRKSSGDGVKCMLKVSGSILNSSNHQENYVGNKVALKLYRPSQYKTSIVNFDGDGRIPAKRRKTHWTSKRQRTFRPVIRGRNEVQCIVNFRNPLKLETVKNVKIVIYENVSASSDLLKQLQDMQPMVILNKRLHS